MPENEINTDTTDNTELTADYMSRINQSFFKMVKNPTQKNIEKHRKTRDALISLWLASLFNNFKNQLYNAAQKGIDTADKKLKEISQKKELKPDKNITADTFNNQVENRYTSATEDIILTSQNIKTNSEAAIKEISNSLQDKINTKSWENLGDVMQRGITEYFDRAGRRWSLENYIEMKTKTEVLNSQRISFFTRATQKGVDLVKIQHLGMCDSGACELCSPFEGKILSINGQTAGYMTIQEAAGYGLFHPNCDHIPDDFELAPDDDGTGKDVDLTEKNKKRFEYNKKRPDFF